MKLFILAFIFFAFSANSAPSPVLDALGKTSKQGWNTTKEERSLVNTSFLDEYECSYLALEWEERVEKKILDHLKQDLKDCRKVVREIDDENLVEEVGRVIQQEIDVEEGRFKGDEDGGEV
ncbi:hypothetical protein Tco_1531271 [Tanacetum coccineum]